MGCVPQYLNQSHNDPRNHFSRTPPLHTGVKKFQCTYEGCTKGFHLRATLTRHMRSHTGEKPYQCKICQRRFADPTNFKRHCGTHTDAKPFFCAVPGCGRLFARKASLKQHGVQVHELKEYT